MRRVQILRGTKVVNDAFIGRKGELTLNTDDNTLRIHDGETAGGYEVGVNSSALERIFIDIAHPVGSWYASDDPTDPSELFAGTTWMRLVGKRGLVACDDETPVGSQMGSSSITLSEEQMPSHTHTQDSCDTQGEHAHERGTMKIVGYAGFVDNDSSSYKIKSSGASGAFYTKSISGNPFNSNSVGSSTFDEGGYFDASRTGAWSGSTDSKGGHSHTVTLNNAGGGESIDIMNPYYATYLWKRIS